MGICRKTQNISSLTWQSFFEVSAGRRRVAEIVAGEIAIVAAPVVSIIASAIDTAMADSMGILQPPPCKSPSHIHHHNHHHNNCHNHNQIYTLKSRSLYIEAVNILDIYTKHPHQLKHCKVSLVQIIWFVCPVQYYSYAMRKISVTGLRLKTQTAFATFEFEWNLSTSFFTFKPRDCNEITNTSENLLENDNVIMPVYFLHTYKLLRFYREILIIMLLAFAVLVIDTYEYVKK